MYQTYILTNPTGRIYIGVSEDPPVRVSQHNEGLSKWTRGKGPWALSWTSKPMSLSEARKLENLLKRQKGGSGLEKIKSLHGSQSRDCGITVQIPPPQPNLLAKGVSPTVGR